MPEDVQQLELIDGGIFFNKNHNHEEPRSPLHSGVEKSLDAESISSRWLVPKTNEFDMSTTMQQAENMMKQFGELAMADPRQRKWLRDGRSHSLSETEMRRMDTTKTRRRRRYNLPQNSFTP